MRIFSFLLLSLPVLIYFGRTNNDSPTPVPATCIESPQADILYLSPDGGRSWQNLNQGLPVDLDVRNIWAQEGTVYLGTSNGDLYSSSNPYMGLWENERVEGAFSNLGGFGEYNPVIGIFPGRTGPFVQINRTGFFRKNQAAGLWESVQKNLEEEWVHAIIENQQGTILISGSTGIYKSAENGQSWKHVYEGYWTSGFARLDNVLICSGQNGLLRSTDGGESWQYVLDDPDGVYRLLADQDRFLAARIAGSRHEAGSTARLLTSVDGGQTWQPLGGKPSPFEMIYEIVQAGNYLYCSHNGGISCSTDDGKSWTLVRAAPDGDGMKRYSLAVLNSSVIAVLVQGGC